MSEQHKDLLIFAAIMAPFWVMGIRFFWCTRDAVAFRPTWGWRTRNRWYQRQMENELREIVQQAKSSNRA